MTHNITSILLATEHSEFDSGAERVALSLAHRLSQPLSLIMPLVSNPEFEAIAPQIAARSEAEAKEHLADIAAAAHTAGVQVHTKVRRGAEPHQEIVAEAQASGAHLVVMRRRGRRGFLAHALVGEMVSRVVAQLPCHALMVPRASVLWSKRLLVAVDPHMPAAARADLAATALNMARRTQLPVTALVVLEVDTAAEHARAEEALQAVRQAAQSSGVDISSEVRVGKAVQQLVEGAHACGSDLLVLGRAVGPDASRSGLGSVARKVVGLIDHPVLVVAVASAAASA